MDKREHMAELEKALLTPLIKPSRGYNAVLGILFLLVLAGLFAWIGQLRQGLVITGMRDQVFWGLYISTFVFFVSISLTGTFLSAVLRITGNNWQTPFNRLAEVITGAALVGAVTMVLVDMGRPDRLLYLFTNGRIQSPLIWDVTVISCYFIGSLIYLYLPLIPDLALCRDRLKSVSSFRHKVYNLMALGWRNTPRQREMLEKLIGLMAVAIIPVAVSVHSVTAWLFAMTYRPGWNSTILAPYFVISAFLSGIAMVIIAMTIYRRIFHLEKFIRQDQYSKLGWLLLGLTLLYAYFSFAEILPGGYKTEGHEIELLNLLLNGEAATLFWFSILGGILVPVILTIWPRTRTVGGLTVASVLVIVFMWVKKSFLLIVPTLEVPLMPFSYSQYRPTGPEWMITIAGFAGFMLLVALFFRFFPLMAVWEVAGHEESTSAKHASNRSMTPAPLGRK